MMYLKKLLQAKIWLFGSIRHLPLLPINSRSNVGATGGGRHGQRAIACSWRADHQRSQTTCLALRGSPGRSLSFSHLGTHRYLNRNDPYGIEHGQPLSSFNT